MTERLFLLNALDVEFHRLVRENIVIFLEPLLGGEKYLAQLLRENRLHLLR